MDTKDQEFAQITLMALLQAQAEREELDKTIASLTRSLADVHGIPATYPLAS